MISWTPENIKTLLSATTDSELIAAFPDSTLETLKRRQRQFRNGELDDTGWADKTAPQSESVGSIESFGDSGTITTGTLDEPVSNWDHIFEIWGLDPQIFEIVEPVRMSAWDVGDSRKYSYKARFQKRALVAREEIPTLNFAKWEETFKKIETPLFVPTKKWTEGEVAYAIWPADPQLGKKNTEKTLENIKRGIMGHVEKIQFQLENGFNIREIVISFMGDEIENICNFYASQTYEIELNLSQQIELDFDQRVWMIRQLMQFGIPLKVLAVVSNHGELSRNGSNRSSTSVYDNAGTMVARMVKKLFDSSYPDFPITWVISEEEQDIIVDIAGVKTYASHGHLGSGSGKTSEFRMKSAIEKQILGRTHEFADVELFFAAHYHHFYTIEDRGRTFFGLPALEFDGNSGYFMDKFGVWSKSGLLGLMVGKHFDRRYQDLSIF